MAEPYLTWQTLSGLYPQLQQALDDRQNPHAWHALLLVGAGGIGKREMAQLLAQAILCLSETDAPCGQCSACERVKSGTHGNLITLEPLPREKSIKIDPTRRVLDALSLHPLEQGLRAVLIPDMDRMTEQAQNAVLKSLEEPDPGTVFIMTTGNERALLPTILSRCRMVRLAPWPAERVTEYLLAHGVAADAAHTWAAMSGGRPMDALRMATDERTGELLRVLNETFLGIAALEDIPKASGALKGLRDDAPELLALLEANVSARMPDATRREGTHTPGWNSASAIALRRVQEKVFEARRYMASNVSWQGIADRLLINIAKEIHQCPV